MEIILLKIVLNSAVLLGFYYLFLEKRKMLVLNRFYLLFSLVFAYTVPFIPISFSFFNSVKPGLIIGAPIEVMRSAAENHSGSFSYGFIFWIIGSAVSVYFLLKFLFSLLMILRLKGEIHFYNQQRVKLIDKELSPFSFLNTIYIGAEYFKNNEMDQRIFLHELCHVKQFHSADILFIEVLKIISWFNPMVFLYRNAIQLNHEYLADEYVLRNRNDVSNYQKLILNELSTANTFAFTHQFNFNNTKKRFKMMTTNKSKITKIAKLSFVPVVGILFLISSKKVEAKTNPQLPSPVNSFANAISKMDPTETNSKMTVSVPELHEKAEIKRDTIRKSTVVTPPSEDRRKSENVDEVHQSVSPTATDSNNVPNFPGGMNAFRNLIAKNLDTSVFSGNEGFIKTSVYFTIDENGDIGEVSAEGNNMVFNREAERTVLSINQKWEPLKENGIAVKYRMTIPLTMSFSNN